VTCREGIHKAQKELTLGPTQEPPFHYEAAIALAYSPNYLLGAHSSLVAADHPLALGTGSRNQQLAVTELPYFAL
jgi:hypothetical protein